MLLLSSQISQFSLYLLLVIFYFFMLLTEGNCKNACTCVVVVVFFFFFLNHKYCIQHSAGQKGHTFRFIPIFVLETFLSIVVKPSLFVAFMSTSRRFANSNRTL